MFEVINDQCNVLSFLLRIPYIGHRLLQIETDTHKLERQGNYEESVYFASTLTRNSNNHILLSSSCHSWSNRT